MATPLAQLTELWGKLKPSQRLAVIGAALATLGLVIALIYFGTQPEFGVLFSDLKPADAQTIVEKLKAGNVPYRLSNGGTTISVPAERIPELRLQMAAAGAISGGHVGFDLFDKTSFGTTDFSQQVNYQRALEGELARTLEGMDEVESARVHITRPRESLFTEKAERAKASAILRTRQGRELQRERVDAVISLIASAVEGLDPSDISVMDTRGRLLSSPGRIQGAGSANAFNLHLEARRKLESETAARIVSLLEPITGPGHVRADVAAEIDLSQIETTEEKFDPKSQVIRSQQTSQEFRSTAAPGLGGVVGARANDPQTQTPPAQASPSPTPAGDFRTAATTNYEIDKTLRRIINGVGKVTRLSVSVVVDQKQVQGGAATPRTPEELKKIQELVAAAVGIEAARGDQIVVQSIPFDQQAASAGPLSWLERYRDLIRTAVKYFALTLAALLIILFVVRPAKRALKEASKPAPLLLPASAAASDGETAPQRRAEDPAPASLPSQTEGEPAVAAAALEAMSPQTVAELEAKMEAEILREMVSPVQEVKRAGAIKKQLIERSKNESQLIAATVRGWLQETK
jgi:flagellar M-ring protein FliF